MIDWALLLAALISVESGGDTEAVGDGGRAVGCLQIHLVYVDDVNRILRGKGCDFRFKDADRRIECMSRNMAVIYLRHYGDAYERTTGQAPTAEVYARIHNGGPDGWKKPATEAYWLKVRARMVAGRAAARANNEN